MKPNHVLPNIIRNFFFIFTVIILGTSLLSPSHDFSFSEIMLVALLALLTDLVSLVYYSKEEPSIKSQAIRTVIHFILIEVIVLVICNKLGYVSGFVENILFAFQILGIYLAVWLIDWFVDRKTANDINLKLKEMRNHNKDERL